MNQPVPPPTGSCRVDFGRQSSEKTSPELNEMSEEESGTDDEADFDESAEQ